MMDNIKDLVQQQLDEQQEQAIILEIYATGSQLFRDNPTDLDYVAICDGFSQRRRKSVIEVDGNIYDLMIYDKEAMIKQLDFSDDYYVHKNLKLYNYFVCLRDVIYGRWDYEWAILSHRESYISYLQQRYQETIGKRVNRTKATKGWVHYYIVLKIYKNNSTTITAEMQPDIKKLYEGGEQVLPIIEFIETELGIINY